MKFTSKGIAALKPKAERYEVWETGRTGFGLRVTPKGRKSFVYMYRFGGKARRLTLGSFPAVSLAGAHVKHTQAKEVLEKGDAPGTLHVGTHKRPPSA